MFSSIKTIGQNMINKKNYIHIFIYLILTVLFIISIINCVYITKSIAKTSNYYRMHEQGIKLKEFEKADKALSIKARKKDFIFKETFSSPFRQLYGMPIRKSPGVSHKTHLREPLFLKGTLIKENALAIIEDQSGKTFICKKGDMVHERKVVSIGEDRVIIKDSGGMETLVVKER